MAKSEAIQRAMAAGARRARVRSAERIYDADTDRNVWEIVLAVTIPRKDIKRVPGESKKNFGDA